MYKHLNFLEKTMENYNLMVQENEAHIETYH